MDEQPLNTEATAAEATATAPALHTIPGIVCAAFLGTFLGAGIVMAINFARLGRKGAAVGTVIGSVVATLGLFVLIFALPEDLPVPNIVFIVPQLLAVYLIAKALQGRAIQEHTESGGKMSSQWRSAGIGLVCLLVVGVGVVGTVLALEPSHGTLMKFGNDEVYLTGDATEADAGTLAEHLKEIEFFTSSGISVKLDRSPDGTVVSFVLIENAWDDPESVEAFRLIGTSLAGLGFPEPLTVELCDEYFTAKKTLAIEQRPESGLPAGSDASGDNRSP